MVRCSETLAEELDELADHAVLAQQLGDREHEIGRRRALRHRAGQADAQHLRDQHRARLAEHRGLRLDAADAPADHAEAVDHRRVRIGADQRVRVRDRVSPSTFCENTTRARCSMLTWWTMPVSGGTTSKLLNARWPQRRNA